MDIATRVDDLYARYGGIVLRRARFLVGRDEAEDVAHEVFLRVLEHLDGFRGEASPATWLYRITTHICLNRLRDASRRRQLLLLHGDALLDHRAHEADPARLAVLHQQWVRLDDELAQVGLYYHVDGMTHDDIAALVGCSASTVRNRLRAIEAQAQEDTEGQR